MPTMTTPRPELAPLIRAEWPKLKRFFESKTPAPDCYDLVQKTLVAWIEKLDAGGVDDPRTYLWGIARFQVLRYLERKRPTAHFDSSIHAVGARSTTLGTRIDRRHQILEALRELPLDQQMAVELRFGEELSLQETADALEVSLATVKRYLKSATEQLRESLGDVAGDLLGDVAAAYRG